MAGLTDFSLRGGAGRSSGYSTTGSLKRGAQRRVSRWWIVGLIAMLSSVVSIVGVSPASADATYSQTVTLPVPPASSFAGFSGGDGWDVSLDQDRVYNVFHHNPNLRFACQNQSDGTSCGSLYPKTITDSDARTFSTLNHSDSHLDHSNGHLYAYAIRSDLTAGVACIDTNLPDANPNPFCGFTELTAIGASGLAGAPHLDRQSLSAPSLIDNKWFAVSHLGASAGQILCFEVASQSACADQPYNAAFSVGSKGYSSSAIDSRFMIQTGNTLGCFNATTLGQCAGSWPVTVEARGAGPFPHLDASGIVTGVCVPNGARSCFDPAGTLIPTPPGMAFAIPRTNPGWSILGGPPVVIGTRVYVVDPNGSFQAANKVGCYDYAALAACSNFPITFPSTAGNAPLGLSLVYTVNVDPYRPSCIWVNSDNGNGQIQAFDAYSGEACGDGPIRVLASQFVVDEVDCFPTAYQSLELIQPAPADYTSAEVEFLDGGGNATLIQAQPFNAGVVDLTGLNLESQPVLPQFLITLTDPPSDIGEVVLKLTWSDEFDPACTGPNTEIEPEPTSVDPAITGAGQTGDNVTVPEGDSATASAGLAGDNAALAGGTVTYTWYSDAACTTVASQGSAQAIVTAGELPDSESVNLAVGTYYVVATYSGDDINEASASTCGDAVLTVESLNDAPVIAADEASVTTPEGTDSEMIGTFSDPDGDAVALTASAGTIVDNLDLTWTWRAAAPDGPAGPYTVTVTADDGNGETASASFDVSVTNVAPDVAAASSAVSTVEGTDAANSGTYGDVAADTVTLSADVGNLTDNANGTWSWTNPAPDGPDNYIVTITAEDEDGGTNPTTFTVMVNNVDPVAAVDTASSSVQYSDPITATTFTATDVAEDSLTMVTSWSSDGAPFAAGLPDLLSASATSCTVSAGVNTCERTVSGIADLAPGAYTVRMTATDDDGGSSSVDTVITVNQEDARSFYIGPLFVSTPSANTGSVDVELRATIQDITAATGDPETDPDAGDIRNATVEFRDDGGALLCTATSVDLVIAGDETVGVATCTWTADIGNNDAVLFEIDIVVGGYYTDTSDNTVVVTVAKPLDNFITGGGYLIATDSAGEYAAGDGERVNYGFNVKFNKKKTNLQGRVTIIVRGADGHKYMIKSNRLSSLGVILGPDGEEPHYAEFEGKANVKDLTDDVDLGGNRTLQMQMWDNGEPGENDTIGFSLWDSSGTLLFSSNWNGVQTVQQTVTGGNLQVH